MSHTFQLAKGKITFEKDNLQIEDAVKKERVQSILLILIAFFQITFTFYLFIKNDDFSWLSYCVAFSLLTIFFLRLMYKLSTQNVILYEEIKSIQLRKRLRNHFMDIRLTNNKIRRLNLNGESIELDEFLTATFKEKKIA